MRRLVSIAALALLGAAFIVSTAFSVVDTGAKIGGKDSNRQVTKIGGSAPSDSNVYGVKVLPTGSMSVVDADRDRDYVLGQSGIINATIAACGADSSIAFPIGAARHITLWIDTKNSAASGDVRLAVQLRLHLSSAQDSTNTAVWSPNMAFGFGSARPDSVGDLAAMPTVQCGAANPDEILVRWHVAHWTAVAGPTNSYFAPRMKVMTFEVAPGAASYFSVRIRNIGVGAPKVVVHYRASAL